MLREEAVELAVGDAPRDDRLDRPTGAEPDAQPARPGRLADADRDRLAVDHEQPRRPLQELNRHPWTLASGVGRERIHGVKDVFFADDAPKAAGPYSHAVRGGDTVYLAGQGPWDPQTGEPPDGFEEQARQTFRNLEAAARGS